MDQAGRPGVRLKPALWMIYVLLLFAVSGLWFLNPFSHKSGAVLRSFPVDDAFIHLCYARSLVEEHCFCFNRGVPEAGMTSPLWVTVLAAMTAAGRFFGLGYLAGAKLLSAVFGLLSAVFAGLLAKEKGSRGYDSASIFLVPALVLLDGHFNFSRLAGMEVTLSAFLILAALYFHSRGRPLLLGMAAGAGGLARPENFLLIGLVVLAWMWQVWKKRQKPGSALMVILPSIVMAGWWFFYNMSVSGHPFPNTYYAKGIPFTLFRPEALWGLVAQGVLALAGFRFGIGVPFYLVGAAYLLRHRRELWLVLLYPWLFIYGLSITRDFAFFEGYYFNRYFQPVIPCLLVPPALGMVYCFQALSGLGRRGMKILSWAGIMCVILLLAGMGFFWGKTLVEQRRMLVSDCEGIRHVHIRLGRWIDKNLPPEARVAAFDVGALGFYGHREIIDLNGLNTHQIIFSPDYLLLKKPGYYLLPADPQEAKNLKKGTWYLRRIKGELALYLSPVFYASANKYSRTRATPYVQVLFKASYSKPRD
jgi:hypothetical protein